MSIAATLSLNLPAITALCIGTRGSQIWSGTGPATTGASSYPVLSGDYYVDTSTGNYYGPYTTSWATSALFTLSFPQTAIPFTTYSSNSSLIVPVYSVNNSILSGSNFSIIFGGQNNTLSGSNLIIFGGLNNTLTGNNSFILGSNIVAGSAVNITFVNNLSSTNNIFASNNITALNSVYTSAGNSNQWSNVFTSVYNTSASWNNVFTSVNNTSASWNNVFTSVNNTSASWNSSYSTLTANSGTWVTYTALTNVSGNWQNTYTLVNTTSANWNNSYTALTANSANWNNSYTTLTANSGNWNSNYTNTFNNSASWYNTYTTVQAYSAGWTSITSASAATYTLNANNSVIPIKGNNTASGTYSHIGGGQNNVNSANCSVIVGGAFNATQTGNAYSSIVGGLGLSAYGNFSHIGGGQNNCISTGGGNASILGGILNCVSSNGSSVVGGSNNSNSGVYSFVAGGSANSVTANNAFVLGSNITATNPNTTYVNNLSVLTNAYIGSKVGIGTTTPTSTLTIAGPGQSYNNSPGIPLSSINTSGLLGNAITIGDTGTAVGNGGTVLFQAASNTGNWNFAAIHGNVTNGSNNSVGDIGFYTRTSSTDAVLSGIPLYIVGGSNKVGIGTQTPNTTLAIAGTLSASGTTTLGSLTVNSGLTVAAGGLTVSSGTTTLQSTTLNSGNLTVSNGNLTVSTGTASLPGTTTSGITSNAVNYFNGNVGIFKNNPIYALDAVGGISVTGGTGSFYVYDQITTGNAAVYRKNGITGFYDSVYGGNVISYNTTGNVGIKGSPGPVGIDFDVSGASRSSNGYLIGTNGGTSGHSLYDAGAGNVGIKAYGTAGVAYFTFNSGGGFSALNGGGTFNGSGNFNGSGYFGGNSNYMLPLTSTGGYDLTLQTNITNRGLYFGGNGDGYSIQSTQLSPTNVFPLTLNPLGGNVGIGTVNPISGKLQVQRSNGNSSNADIYATDGTQWIHLNSNEAIGSYNTLVQNNDASIIYSGGSIDNTNSAIVIGPWSSTAKGIRINNSGYVGIGVTTPNQALTVNGNVSASGSLYAGSCLYAGYNGGVFYGDDTNLALRPPAVTAPNGATFFQNNAGTITTMYVDSNTNYCVGIGTTTPNATLTVNGTLSASFGTTIGTLTAQNLITNGNEVIFSDGVGTNDTGNGANTISLNYTNGAYVGLSGAGQLYALGVPRYTYLTANTTAIGSGLAAFFTATPTDALFGAGVYEIEAFLLFTKTTAGTLSAVFTGTSSFYATTELHINTTISSTGSLLTTTVGESFTTQNSNGSNNAPLGVSSSLTNGSNYGVRIKALIQNLTGATNNVGIYLLQSAGTLTPLNGSYRKVTRVA